MMFKLKEILQEKGISVRAFSAESCISLRTLQDAIKRDDCRLSTARKIADHLGCKIDDLYQEESQD